MDAVSLLQVGTAFVQYAAFAWLAGSWCSRFWLPSAALQALRSTDLLAAGLAALAGLAWLWAATAVMAGESLGESLPMLWTMLRTTGQGAAGSAAIAAMLAVLAARRRCRPRQACIAVQGLALLAFAVARASLGHAGESGWWSLPLLAETVHFIAAAIWSGIVCVSGWQVLRPATAAPLTPAQAGQHLAWMSHTALAAVLAIALTGLYNGVERVGAADNLLHTGYGIALLVKVVLVALAIGMGGFNKFVGMPAAASAAQGATLVRHVLLLESIVLLSVLAVASWLVTQAPPGAM